MLDRGGAFVVAAISLAGLASGAFFAAGDALAGSGLAGSGLAAGVGAGAALGAALVVLRPPNLGFLAAAASAFNLAFSAFRSLYANQTFLTRRWKWPLVITSILWNSS